MKFVATKKGLNFFSPPSWGFWIRDPRWVKIAINIPDPQQSIPKKPTSLSSLYFCNKKRVLSPGLPVSPLQHKRVAGGRSRSGRSVAEPGSQRPDTTTGTLVRRRSYLELRQERYRCPRTPPWSPSRSPAGRPRGLQRTRKSCSCTYRCTPPASGPGGCSPH